MESDPPQSRDDALGLANTVRRLVQRARRTPGLLDGHVARLRREVERLIEESSRPSRGKHRELIRGANDFAAEVVDLRRSGALAPKFVAILDRALVNLRKRHFDRSREGLRKLDRPLALAREIEETDARYRRFYDGIARESEGLRTEIAKLETVPKPDRSPEECAGAKRRLADLQQAIDLAYSSWIHESPALESIPVLLDISQVPDTTVPFASEPGAVGRLLEFLPERGSVPGPLRAATVSQLRELSSYSDAKFAYVMGDDLRGRSVLRENASWLVALCATGATAFRFRTLESLRMDHVTALRTLLHHSLEGMRLVDDLATALTSAEWESLLRSARLYDLYGELARKRWGNRLSAEIQELRGRQEALARDLAAMPRPERLMSQ